MIQIKNLTLETRVADNILVLSFTLPTDMLMQGCCAREGVDFAAVVQGFCTPCQSALDGALWVCLRAGFPFLQV